MLVELLEGEAHHPGRSPLFPLRKYLLKSGSKMVFLRKGLILCFQLRKCDVRCVQIQHGILPEIQVCEKPLGSEEGESLLLRAMVKLLCMLAFSCVAHYWMQAAANEELMQIKAMKEEVATMQEDLVNLRDEMVVFEKTCLMVS